MDYRPFGLLDLTPGMPAGGVSGRTPTGADDLGRLVYSMTGAGGAQDAVGLLGGPSVRENLRAGNNFDAGLQMLAALPVVGMLGTAGKVARGAQDAAKAAEEARGIVAYHGSPHSFDKFDLSKIGTGEGAQAYGHGLYFAEAEPVAEGYRKKLASDTLKTPSGEIFDPQTQLKHLNVRVAARNSGVDLDAPLSRAQQLLPKASEQTRPLLEADIATLQALKDAGGVSANPGSMYQVRINADPNAFLDWDKPLSEQSPVVREVVKSVVPNVEKRGGPALSSEEFAAKYGSILRGTPYEALPERALTSVLSAGPEASKDFVELVRATNPEAASKLNRAIANYGSPTGEQIYHALGSSSATNANFLRAPDRGTEASAAFREAGIPGIKYLDAGSRGSGEGSRNYVVFDDSIIDILKKYGLVGLLGGGAAASGMSGMNNPAAAGGGGAPGL